MTTTQCQSSDVECSHKMGLKSQEESSYRSHFEVEGKEDEQ